VLAFQTHEEKTWAMHWDFVLKKMGKWGMCRRSGRRRAKENKKF
jgi:hypothetical protein